MQQVLRRGLKDIVVDEVPDPVVAPHHVLIRSWYFDALSASRFARSR